MSTLKIISVEHLKVGMYVTDHTTGIADNQFKGKGFIRRPDTIDKLRDKSIQHVIIDTAKGPDSPFAIPLQIEEIELTPVVPLEDERERAGRIYGEALSLVENIHQQAKLGQAIHLAPLEELASDLSQSMHNNHNALLCLSQLREKNRYLLEHSINCGILYGLFARFLGYDSDTCHELITAGMLMDCGMARIDDELLLSSGSLSKAQKTAMQRHVEYGAEMLRGSDEFSEETLLVISQHHERLDGSGYPLGIDDRAISAYGRIAAIVDGYDAMTADRPYRAALSPAAAMKELAASAGRALDKNLTYRFIRCMGVYPVGTIVELDNGRAGVVLEASPHHPDKPVVRIFYNTRHHHQEAPKIVDLASPRNDHKIISTLTREELGVSINDHL